MQIARRDILHNEAPPPSRTASLLSLALTSHQAFSLHDVREYNDRLGVVGKAYVPSGVFDSDGRETSDRLDFVSNTRTVLSCTHTSGLKGIQTVLS